MYTYSNRKHLRNCALLLSQSFRGDTISTFRPLSLATLGMAEGLLGEWHYTAFESEEVEATIPTYTIDDIWEKFAFELSDLTKMDIEGGEVGFLADDGWCEKMLGGTHLLVELHHFKAFSLSIRQLLKNGLKIASKLGEYWITLKLTHV